MKLAANNLCPIYEARLGKEYGENSLLLYGTTMHQNIETKEDTEHMSRNSKVRHKKKQEGRTMNEFKFKPHGKEAVQLENGIQMVNQAVQTIPPVQLHLDQLFTATKSSEMNIQSLRNTENAHGWSMAQLSRELKLLCEDPITHFSPILEPIAETL